MIVTAGREEAAAVGVWGVTGMPLLFAAAVQSYTLLRFTAFSCSY